MRLHNLILALPLLVLTACGAGGDGRDEIQPPLIENQRTLIAAKQIAIGVQEPGELIHGEGIGPDRPDSICGNIKSFHAYRDDTHVYFRIEEGLGFCWDLDLYEVIITNILWRGVPGAVIFANNGNPADGGNGQGVFNPQVGNPSADAALTPQQFKYEADDPFFFLKVPISLFNFVEDDGDSDSVFNIQVLIERPSGPVIALDFTGGVHVELAKP